MAREDVAACAPGAPGAPGTPGAAGDPGISGVPGAGDRRRPLRWLVAGLVLAVLGFLEHVRGHPVRAPERGLEVLVEDLTAGTAHVLSRDTLDDVGSLAFGLVVEEGRRPGPFHLQFLPRLDRLEKVHHLVHSPFSSIRTLYCDIWIHSLTTYGTREQTWAFHSIRVVPALKLPVLLFLLDRLGRGRSAASERLGAVFEAVGGMSIHERPGRARVWDRLLGHAIRHPPLVAFLARQLGSYDWEAVDRAEIAFWQHVAIDPRRAGVEAMMRGEIRDSDRPRHPAAGTARLAELVASYRSTTAEREGIATVTPIR